MTQQNLDELYELVKQRKENPIDGSYTDYLLKKVGEETTEVIVAAKNSDPAELQYETADLLYHLMVLLVECNLPFEKIKEELGSRVGQMSQFKDRAPIKKL